MADHSRPSGRKQPDDLPAEPNSPSWTRRGFVRTASGLFVASSFPALNACATTDLISIPTGTVGATVTGFDPKATKAGTLCGPVDGQALSITLSPPSAGSSSGEATNVPVGTYDVTYKPPDDHGLSSADLGMETKSVTVSATSGGNLSWDVDPKTGMVLVTITGFPDTATEAGTISGDLPITLSAPTAGTSSGESGQVLIGTYDVTYVPPVGYRLINADIGSPTKRATVSENAGSELVWGVDPSLESLDVLFHSDWSTATGETSAALLDTDKPIPWDSFRSNSSSYQIVVATGLDFPTTNVLRTDAIWRGSPAGAFAGGNRLSNGIPNPAVGNSLFYRVYLRVATPDAYTADNLTHPYQDGPSGSQTNWQHEVVTSPNGTWIHRLNTGNAWPNNRWPSPTLNKNQTYRFELQIHRIGTTTWNAHVRLYDSSDRLIATDADYNNINNSANLASTPTFTFNNISFLTGLQIGGNGWAGGVAGDYGFIAYYWGGLCVRTNDWCGPYANGI